MLLLGNKREVGHGVCMSGTSGSCARRGRDTGNEILISERHVMFSSLAEKHFKTLKQVNNT